MELKINQNFVKNLENFYKIKKFLYNKPSWNFYKRRNKKKFGNNKIIK